MTVVVTVVTIRAVTMKGTLMVVMMGVVMVTIIIPATVTQEAGLTFSNQETVL